MLTQSFALSRTLLFAVLCASLRLCDFALRRCCSSAVTASEKRPPMPLSHTDNDTWQQSIAPTVHYTVRFTHDAFAPGNPALAETLTTDGPLRPALVYLDSGLVQCRPELPAAVEAYAAAHADALRLAAAPVVLPGGEAAKSDWQTVNRVLADLQTHRFCRHSFVLVVGGGALLDAAGLAASLFHRGVRLVRMPSTTLSQGDGGVGVKTGINLGDTKNALGTFAAPFAVLNDLALLGTLPHDVMLDGVAEAFKVGIVRDAALFAFMEDAAERLGAGEPGAIGETVRRSAVAHLEHIGAGGDPFELGTARPLDFGHWSAHRLESLSDYTVRHGQAVGIGIALDACYAAGVGLLTAVERDRILNALARTGLALCHPLLSARDADGRLRILTGLGQFREHLGGALSVTLPNGIGRRVEVDTMDEARIAECIAALEQRARL
jgi:3-dehydroquinate synthase